MKRRRKRAVRARDPKRGAARMRLRIALGVLSVAGLIAFYRYFEGYLRESPEFMVRTVEIEGLDFLDEEEIVEQSGITHADNVFYFDPEKVKAQIERVPYVRSCSVTVSFPDTVVLAIEERRPVASLLINSHAYEIDDEGVVLREYPWGEMPRGPYITCADGLQFIVPGKPVNHDNVAAALEVWRASRSTGIDRLVTISEFAAFGPDDIRMYCDDFRYEVRWGRGDYERQALRLAAFWKEVGLRGVCSEYLDLRFGQDLACK